MGEVNRHPKGRGRGSLPVEMVGRKFHRLTVMCFEEKRGKQLFWKCLCDCSKETVVLGTALRVGKTKSCGCLRRDFNFKHGHAGDNSKSATYVAWTHAKSRCYDPANKKYKHYGGRGITMCDRWLESFADFLADMGEKPRRGLTLERVNNSGNYEPGNCEWRTYTDQNNNLRSNRNLEYGGIKMSMAMWTRELKFPRNLIFWRLKKGWTVEDALSTPLVKHQSIRERHRSASKSQEKLGPRH